jgi:hypothetical protein
VGESIGDQSDEGEDRERDLASILFVPEQGRQPEPDAGEAIFATNIKSEEETILSRHEYSTILGRPIRLADVLLATIGKGIAVNSIGVFLSDEEGMMPHTFRAAWNLRADDLREQSDETVEFLYELLK